MIKITIKDKVYEYPFGTPILSIAEEFKNEYKEKIVLANYNNRLRELNTPINEDGTLELITMYDKNGNRTYRRSAVLLLQKAISDVCGEKEVDVRVMYSIGNGYFCKLVGANKPDKEYLDDIKSKMKELVDSDIQIKKYSMPTSDAKKMFCERGMNNKQKLLRYRANSLINIYELGGVRDYFYGYMVPSTKYIGEFDLYAYDDGFILSFANKDKLPSVMESPGKLYKVFKESTEWSSMMGISTVGSLNDVIASGQIQDVVMMQEALMEERIGSLAREIASRKECKFVMIAGPSSSGKTTFSHRLSVQLKAQGLKPHPLPLDDYYLDRGDVPLDEFGQRDFECLEALDIKRFNDDMTTLLSGKTAVTPIFNFKTGKRDEATRSIKLGDNDILVIEGIHGLNDDLSYSLPKESKFKIYISAISMLAIDEHNPLSTSDGRLLRRIVRDSRMRATPAKETIAMWDSVQRGETKNIFPYQEQADVMFNSALIYELAVMKLYAQPQLYAITPEDEEYAEAKRLMKLLDYVIPMPTEGIANNSLIREFIGGSCFYI